MSLVKEAQSILEAAPASGMSPEDEKRFDGLMGEADKVEANIKRAEELAADQRDIEAAYRPGTKPDTRNDDPETREAAANKAESRAFTAFLRGGLNNLTGEQRKIMEARFESRSLAEGTGSAGGFLVPQDFYRKLTEAYK